MSAGEQLTTLGRVKSWLDIPSDNTDADAILNVMIKSASAFVLNYLNRSGLALTGYSELYDGYGNSFMMLRHSPVVAVSGVSFSGSVIAPAQGDGITQLISSGFLFRDGRLNVFGYNFPRARSSVMVQYTAGYVADDEVATVPETPGPYTVTTQYKWLGDVSVQIDGGAVLTKVTGAPGAGEYAVSSEGVYTFNVAQEGASVLISYSYVPPDIEQATWEMVGERYKYRDRIGTNSKSLGGQETVSFSQTAMTHYIRELLQPYKRVVPVA